MYLKNKYLIIACLSTLISCGQDKKKIMLVKDKITIENYTEELKKNVKLYEEQPMYLLRINQEYCTYEVLVNDFPVEKHYSRGKNATGVKINKAILKSGEQTVTIRMYPFGDLLQKAFGDEQPYFNTLKGGSSVQVEVIKADWKNYDIAKEQTIKVYQTEGYDTNKFPGAGLPYYEFSFTFTAKVPYVFEGWSNGVDLRTIDSTILRKKILDYFKGYQKIYKNKDINTYLTINFNQTVREITSNYFAHPAHDGDNIFDELKEQYLNRVMIEEKDFLPLKDYKLAFFGNGRIATFKQSSSHKTDKRFRGKSALHFLYKNNGENFRKIISPYIYIYIDKAKYNGREEDLKLEMIK